MRHTTRVALAVVLLIGVFISGCQFGAVPFTLAQGNIVSQGVSLMRVDAWHEAGFTGSGVKVGIWDFGFFEYDLLLGTDLPPANQLTARAFGIDIQGDPEEIQSDPDGPRHGTAVAEVVYDIAPDAEFFLFADSGEQADTIEGLRWLISEGVDVVVASLSLGELGCLDVNNSPFEPIFIEMRQAGILLVASSGNDRTAHWQGVFEDTNGDGFHDFTANDDSITFEGFEGESVDLLLSWEDPCLTSENDYELLLFDENGNLVGEGIEFNNETRAQEFISEALPADGFYDVVIEQIPGAQDVLLDLVWANGPEFEHNVVDGSVSFFEPAISPNALTVGSLVWGNLVLEDSSSQGPTKDGRIKPDVVAPTCVQTISYGGSPTSFDFENCGFSGTSAAAPHAAGVAVLIKQANPDFTPDQIQQFMESNAQDFGAPGKDNVYGSGFVQLPPPPQGD